MTGNQWYDNKDLFEMIQVLKKEMAGLMNDLTQTRQEIKVYNNLRGTLNQTMSELNDLKIEFAESQSKAVGRQSVANGIIKWGGWLIGLVGLFGKAFGWW